MFVSFCLALAALPAAIASNLPVVDLGYEHHQAISLNETGGYYNFSNIRYAAPPIGELRFAAPIPPQGRSSAVNDGSKGVICPQANPAWEAIAAEFIPAYLTGQPFNLTTAEAALANSSGGGLPPQDPRTTEDCLFLDVIAPQKIFRTGGRGAPVVVWIYGGGYTSGEKSGFGVYNAAGLIKSSQISGSDGIVYVALNYRLGALGWLAGPTLQANGTANAALYDQRLALEWVQKYIHLFGGDKSRVTVIGESAGGGSIFHQITAFGGLSGPAPFAQAIPQSAAFQVLVSPAQQEATAQAFLSLLKVSSIEEARQLPSEALITANIIQVGGSPYGGFTYGPVVDGLFAPAPPGKLLLQGSYDHNVKILAGHNADEGLLFTNPAVTTDAAYTTLIETFYPSFGSAALNYLETVLYPPVYDGSKGYTTEFQRAIILLAESAITCNAVYLETAFSNPPANTKEGGQGAFGYQFSVPPALHGMDVPFTFANGPNSAGVTNDTVAQALQDYITSFVEKGVPSGPTFPSFPLYGNDSEIIDLNVSGIVEIMDPTVKARCDWWQKAVFY